MSAERNQTHLCDILAKKEGDEKRAPKQASGDGVIDLVLRQFSLRILGEIILKSSTSSPAK